MERKLLWFWQIFLLYSEFGIPIQMNCRGLFILACWILFNKQILMHLQSIFLIDNRIKKRAMEMPLVICASNCLYKYYLYFAWKWLLEWKFAFKTSIPNIYNSSYIPYNTTTPLSSPKYNFPPLFIAIF